MTDRIPNSEGRRPRPDWWARLFAVGGLAAGAASLYYSWIHTTSLPSTQEIVSSYHAEFEKFLGDAQAKLNEQDRLEAVARKDRNDLEWEAIKGRDAKFSQHLAKLSQPGVAAADQMADGEVADGEVEAYTDMVADTSDAGDNLFEDLFGTGDMADAGDARLQVTQRTLRPTEPTDAEIATISNTTEFDASVRAIQFTPNSLYEVSPDVSSGSTTLGSTDLDIQLLRTDNQARDPNKQGSYRRVLSDPITVSAGGRPNVRVQIQNTQHLGWGMRGTLVLEYGGRQLEIPNVSARFVAER